MEEEEAKQTETGKWRGGGIWGPVQVRILATWKDVISALTNECPAQRESQMLYDPA
jgi:hypothetical protein